MTGEKGILHMSISNRSSSLTQKSSLCRKRNSWNCWGLLNARQTAVLMHQRSDVLQLGGGQVKETAPQQHWSCSILAPVARQQCQGPPGTLPMAMWEPCPGSKSTSLLPEEDGGALCRWR